ncbi:unnamed protein product [Lathyrus sativus]|nr:unnamed protein product [Lathyrus sativus]
MQPFDVGDRCEIDTVQMVVEEMNILTTVFLRYDNLKITIPNSVLATKATQNSTIVLTWETGLNYVSK